ncbi:hypothetical protein [Deinococcus hopiensis]|uniref:hypothetical protein n=1 Tax=Deinococcus hopiensis TaxID=309885 RepID=UPI001BAFA1AE|nr:hypothetical protein [Deinococcus hopiensis]
MQRRLNRVDAAEDAASHAAQNERPLAVVEQVAAEVQQKAEEGTVTSKDEAADQHRN